MIVDPDFPDHWKTRMLVGLLDGDEASGMYVIRLWGHCQLRRQWRFANLSPEALKALCRFPGHANKLDASLVTSGFIRREADALTVCGWDDYNASLIAAWGNGSKGGRPPKPVGLDVETHGKPTGSRVEEIGGEKKGGEKIRFVPPTVSEVAAYVSTREVKIDPERFVDHYTANGWVQGRRGKPVVDWKACVRTWEKNGDFRSNGTAANAKRAEFDRVFDEFGKKAQS